MKVRTRLIAGTAALLTLLVGAEVMRPVADIGSLGLTGQAEARVGRPLTPVSVAGVARRTVRRCAAGVYYC